MQDDRRAASRAACTAGKSSATKTPMMAITTNSSTRVKPRFVGRITSSLPAANNHDVQKTCRVHESAADEMHLLLDLIINRCIALRLCTLQSDAPWLCLLRDDVEI